jgi:CHAT domain-containing protein
MLQNQSGLISISGLYHENREIFEAGIRSSYLMNEIVPNELTLYQLSSFMESSRMNFSRMLYEFNRMIGQDGIEDSIRIKKILLEEEINALEGEINQNSSPNADKLFKLKQEFDQLNFKIKKTKNELSSESRSLPDIQKRLKKTQVLIQYYFVEDELYCLASTRNTNQLIILPWGANERTNLNELQKALRNPGQLKNAMEYGLKVYQSLNLDNLTKTNPKELIIIPDKELHYLPFDALLAPDGDFLIENYTIYYKNSLFFFDNQKTRGKVATPVLGMAPFSEQITNDRVLARRGSPDPGGSYLPGSADEVDYIHELFGGKIKHGEFATEAFFRENSSETGVIHLATHAQLDDANPLYNTFAFAANFYDKPDKNDDGLLHTHELYSMNFNADLVTLSACNSGIGKFYDGEGVMSLASAFRIAGANNIVMSLWSLPDDATSAVMRDFYSQLNKSVKKASALRSAKLKYLENADMNSRSPYFWAATVYIGDNTVLLNKNNTLLYFIGAFLILFFAVGIVFRIRGGRFKK